MDKAQVVALVHSAAQALEAVGGIGGNWNDPAFTAARRAVETHLRGENDLKMFDNQAAVGPMGTGLNHYGGLTQWLVERTLQTNAATAIDDLERYITNPSYRWVALIAIAGIIVKRDFQLELAPGLTLAGLDELRNHWRRNRLWEQVEAFDYFLKPGAVLVHTIAQPRLHLATTQGYKPPTLDEMFALDIPWQDAILCASLIGPCGPAVAGIWRSPGEEVPIYTASSGGMRYGIEIGQRPRDFSEADAQVARDILTKFNALQASEKSRLRIPLRRLNSALRRHNLTDIAIDLGIALESIFADTESGGEFTYKIRVRAAHYLGTTSQARKDIYDLAGDLYGLRSKAAHTGSVPRGTNDSNYETLMSGALLISEVLKRQIDKPTNDWKSVVLGL